MDFCSGLGTLTTWTGNGGSGGIAVGLGLVGDREHFCTFVQLSLNISLPLVLREEGRSVSQSNIWGKVPVCCPGSAVPPLCMEKVKEKGELVTDMGRGPMRRHRREQALLGNKERGEPKQTNPRRKRSGWRRSYRVLAWGPELPHIPAPNPRPPRAAVMCEPYFGKPRQGQPQLPGEAVPAPPGARRAASWRCWCRWGPRRRCHGEGREGRCPRRGRTHNTSHVSRVCAKTKSRKTPPPPRSHPLPPPTCAGNGW